MVFVSCPEGVPAGTATRTEIVQVPGVVEFPAGIVPPLRPMLDEPAFAVTFPPQVFVTDGLGATIIGLGRGSVTLTPVYGAFVGFCNVRINVVVPPAENVGGENRFARPISRTFSRAVAAVAFERFWLFWSALGGIRLS